MDIKIEKFAESYSVFLFIILYCFSFFYDLLAKRFRALFHTEVMPSLSWRESRLLIALPGPDTFKVLYRDHYSKARLASVYSDTVKDVQSLFTFVLKCETRFGHESN